MAFQNLLDTEASNSNKRTYQQVHSMYITNILLRSCIFRPQFAVLRQILFEY